MEDLAQLQSELKNFIEEQEEQLGSEIVMQYLIILKGILSGIEKHLEDEQ